MVSFEWVDTFDLRFACDVFLHCTYYQKWRWWFVIVTTSEANSHFQVYLDEVFVCVILPDDYFKRTEIWRVLMSKPGVFFGSKSINVINFSLSKWRHGSLFHLFWVATWKWKLTNSQTMALLKFVDEHSVGLAVKNIRKIFPHYDVTHNVFDIQYQFLEAEEFISIFLIYKFILNWTC